MNPRNGDEYTGCLIAITLSIILWSVIILGGMLLLVILRDNHVL